MNAEAVVQQARELGITLSIAGDRIRYAPKSQAPEDFIAALREHKLEIIDYLSRGPAELEPGDHSSLLGWASEQAEQLADLSLPVTYIEAPRRTVTTTRVSWYATRYLQVIIYARQQRQRGGWGQWAPDWWKEREDEALAALAALKTALEKTETPLRGEG